MIKRQSVKDLLVQSFMEISKEKNIDRISINDIVENAGVSRKTFYNNFLDKYDLIKWIHETNCKNIAGKHINCHPVVSCRVMFEYIRENIYFYRYLLQERQDEVYRSLYQVTMEIMGGYILAEAKKEKLSIDEEFQLSCHVHGSMQKIFEWIQHPERYSEKDIARFLTLSWPMGLAKYMRIKDNDITKEIVFCLSEKE